MSVCPRCQRPIEATMRGPSFDDPAGHRVTETFGEGHCIDCEWDAPTLSPVNREEMPSLSRERFTTDVAGAARTLRDDPFLPIGYRS